MSYLLIFVYSALIDAGAVLYTRSVQSKNVLLGMFTTGGLAALNWASIWMVTRQADRGLMLASIAGHVVGYAAGIFVPVRGECGTGRPSTGTGSQSSDPS